MGTCLSVSTCTHSKNKWYKAQLVTKKYLLKSEVGLHRFDRDVVNISYISQKPSILLCTQKILTKHTQIKNAFVIEMNWHQPFNTDLC